MLWRMGSSDRSKSNNVLLNGPERSLTQLTENTTVLLRIFVGQRNEYMDWLQDRDNNNNYVITGR